MNARLQGDPSVQGDIHGCLKAGDAVLPEVFEGVARIRKVLAAVGAPDGIVGHGVGWADIKGLKFRIVPASPKDNADKAPRKRRRVRQQAAQHLHADDAVSEGDAPQAGIGVLIKAPPFGFILDDAQTLRSVHLPVFYRHIDGVVQGSVHFILHRMAPS